MASPSFSSSIDVVSAMQTAFTGLAKILKDQVTTSATGATTILKGFADSLSAFANIANGLATSLVNPVAGIEKMAAGLGELGASAAVILGGLGLVVKGLGGLGEKLVAFGSQMAQFVGVLNPALFQLFNRAVLDLQANIGEALVPVFKIVVNLIRDFTDSLTTFLPQLGAIAGQIATSLMPIFQVMFKMLSNLGQAFVKIFESMQPFIAMLVEIAQETFEAMLPVFNELVRLAVDILVPTFHELANIFREMAPYLIAFTKAFTTFLHWVIAGIRELLEISGGSLIKFEDIKPGAGAGKAATSVTTTSIEEALKKARESAFGIGAGTIDPHKETAKHTLGIKEAAEKIYQEILKLPENVWKKIETLPDLLWAKFKNLPAEIVARATPGVSTGITEATAWWIRAKKRVGL